MGNSVIQVSEDSIKFDNGIELTSDHAQDCCESHYLAFKTLSLKDFEGLKFDLSGNSFFERVDGYGIRLIPINGHPVSIPGYGYNNGYYSANLQLILIKGSREFETFDITECQERMGG